MSKSAAVFGLIYVSEHGFHPEDWEPTTTFAVLRHRSETVTVNGQRQPLLLRDIDRFRASL